MHALSYFNAGSYVFPMSVHMKITQIIQGVYNPSAGPTYSVAKLADQLYTLGEDASVLTLGEPPAVWPYEAPLTIHDGVLERKTGVSLSMMAAIRRLSKSPGILHGHGIWRVANLFPLFTDREGAARIVYSPRGTLSPWSMQHKILVKQPFWRLLQKPALQRCHCFHATAPAEYEDIRRVGLRGPVTIIPNGVDIPDIPANNIRRKRVAFLSRIDPIKGLDILLPTWAAIADEFSDWDLVIAGPLGNDYADSIQTLAETLNAPRVKFAGQVLGETKHRLLTEASLFVLPSYSENFGMAVAEALAHGTPVITTTETPWSDLHRRNCGWCIAPQQPELEQTLRNAMSRPLESLREMGENGREWMRENYAWDRVAGMMMQTYKWLHDKAPRPDCVAT